MSPIEPTALGVDVAPADIELSSPCAANGMGRDGTPWHCVLGAMPPCFLLYRADATAVNQIAHSNAVHCEKCIRVTETIGEGMAWASAGVYEGNSVRIARQRHRATPT